MTSSLTDRSRGSTALTVPSLPAKVARTSSFSVLKPHARAAASTVVGSARIHAWLGVGAGPRAWARAWARIHAYVENTKPAQLSASWRSGGAAEEQSCSQWAPEPQAAPSTGPPRPLSRLGPHPGRHLGHTGLAIDLGGGAEEALGRRCGWQREEQ